jgi:transcriptional regulator with XRE-family HTH domain
MSNSWVDQRIADPDTRRLFEQERLILSATSRIYESMEAAEVSKADLARDLATSRANVTALLSGSRNMTLRTLADLASVLGQRVEISLEPLRYGEFVSAPVRMVRTMKSRVVESSPVARGSELVEGRVSGEELAA